MLFFLIVLLLLTSIILLILRPSRRSTLLSLTIFSLLAFWISILIYIAKKGGIGGEVSFILFGSHRFRSHLQYLHLTLAQLGYFIAITKFIFPPLFLWTTLEYVYLSFAHKIKKRIYLIFILPLLFIVIYYPALFKVLFLGNEIFLKSIVYISKFICYIYIIFAFITALAELHAITVPFFKRRFISKILLLTSLAILYLIFSPQDPAQVYLFYSNDYMWLLGLWYLSKNINMTFYTFFGIVSVIFGAVGFFSIIKYISVQWDEVREEATLRRKANYASLGAGVFLHGIKNELLAALMLISRYKNSGDSKDLGQLEEINKTLLKRTELLYGYIKQKEDVLLPVLLRNAVNEAIEKLHSKYSDAEIELIDKIPGALILADHSSISEAIYNLLINGYEAELSANKEPKLLKIVLSNERLWTSIVIKDNGHGISNKDRKKIWEPFYSTKNASTSWGLGMYYTRSIIKKHFGLIRFDSEIGRGTEFTILLPKWGREGGERFEDFDS